MKNNNLDELQSKNLLVTKIGGDNAGLIRQNYKSISTRIEAGQKQVLVVSAMRSSDKKFSELRHDLVQDRDSSGIIKSGFNTTSHLIAIAAILEQKEEAKEYNKEDALKIISHIKNFTKGILEREIQGDKNIDQNLIFSLLEKSIQKLQNKIQSFDVQKGDEIIHMGEDCLIKDRNGEFFSLTGFGEILSKDVYQAYFQAKNINSETIDVDEDYKEIFSEEQDDSGEKKSAEERLKKQIRTRTLAVISENDVLITGGYAPHVASQRGYSDKMGAYMATEIKKIFKGTVAYVIEKEFSILSIDRKKLSPEDQDKAKVINKMSFDFAREVFGKVYGADAGAVQAEALDALARNGVNIFVLNPENLKSENITHIGDFETPPNGIEMIATKKAPHVLQIKSSLMGRPGILNEITTWFLEKDISIDQVATSETTITLSFGNNFNEKSLKDLEKMLDQKHGKNEFEFRLERNLSLIYCLGNNMAQPGNLSRATVSLEQAGVNILMVSQGINERSIVFAMEDKNLEKALSMLHRNCIEHGDKKMITTFE